MVRFKEYLQIQILCHDNGFNSYMVRFKALHYYASMVAKKSFNSYMVRFKVNNSFAGQTSYVVSIPIWFDLKVSQMFGTGQQQPGFNSYMVRFKVIGFVQRINCRICFNSYMVRFKAGIRLPVRVVTKMFQFLYGSI